MRKLVRTRRRGKARGGLKSTRSGSESKLRLKPKLKQTILFWVFSAEPEKLDFEPIEREVRQVSRGSVTVVRKDIAASKTPESADEMFRHLIFRLGKETVVIVVEGQRRQHGLAAAIAASASGLVIAVPNCLSGTYDDWRTNAAVNSPVLTARDLLGATRAALTALSLNNPKISRANLPD